MIVMLSDIELKVSKVSDHNVCLSVMSAYFADHQLPRLGQQLLELKHPAIKEVIATGAEILIQHTHHSTTQLMQELAISNVKANEIHETQSWTLPVSFSDGDWDRVEQYTGLSSRDYQQQLTASVFTVAMYGFIPGFTYLNGLPTELCVPRKSEPSKQVAAGSIALGGKYFGIYAVTSPAGWNVIGSTPLRILETPKVPPVSFCIGDQVQLKVIDAVDAKELQHLSLSEYNHIEH